MSKLPSIPDVPLEIDSSIREVLEPMKEILDYLTGQLTIENLPKTDPRTAGKVWNNAGILTISAG